SDSQCLRERRQPDLVSGRERELHGHHREVRRQGVRLRGPHRYASEGRRRVACGGDSKAGAELMAGYDDPRFLQQVIEKLQKDVEQLKKSTIPVLAQQRGPTPGWINAGQFGPGPGMKSSMHMHNDGNQAGVAPRLSVTDASGVVRVELGNL